MTTRSVGIPVLADAVVDDGETVLLHLTAPVNGVLVRCHRDLDHHRRRRRPPLSSWWCGLGHCTVGASSSLTGSVRPGFVTGPATPPLGEGSFRYDTGAPGAAAAGAKVELSNGSLNDQPVANLTGLRFDAYVEENDAGASRQPYVNLKVDADNNGSIDTTLAYEHTPIPLNAWTSVDTFDGTATGAVGWFCTSTVVDLRARRASPGPRCWTCSPMARCSRTASASRTR